MRERWDMDIPLPHWIARNIRRTATHSEAELHTTIVGDLSRARGAWLSRGETNFARQHFKNWRWRI